MDYHDAPRIASFRVFSSRAPRARASSAAERERRCEWINPSVRPVGVSEHTRTRTTAHVVDPDADVRHLLHHRRARRARDVRVRARPRAARATLRAPLPVAKTAAALGASSSSSRRGALQIVAADAKEVPGTDAKGLGKALPMEMDIDAIMKLLPHRYPFLLVDRVLEIEQGRTRSV